MKNNQKKKYPLSLFIMGLFMNLIKNFLLFFSSIVLLVIGIWIKWCLFLGLILMFINIAISLSEQIQIRNTVLNSNNPNFTKYQEAILSSDWRDNVRV